MNQCVPLTLAIFTGVVGFYLPQSAIMSLEDDPNQHIEVGNTSAGGSSPRVDNPQLVDQVFSMFKSYLTTQLDEKGKQLESKSRIEKEATQFKFKGNRKQFEINSKILELFSNIEQNIEDSAQVRKFVSEGKELIIRRQKLIKLADRSKDGWLVVQEYESDDLASDSEDEKRIRNAKAAAEKKRKESKPNNSTFTPKRFKSSNDNQLFRGKDIFVYFVCSQRWIA